MGIPISRKMVFTLWEGTGDTNNMHQGDVLWYIAVPLDVSFLKKTHTIYPITSPWIQSLYLNP